VGAPAPRDWVAWHQAYDAPGSPLARRLALVQAQLRDALDRAPRGPARLVSLCAGQGRDVLAVLATHPRGRDVQARLVEVNPELCATARAHARHEHLAVEVVAGDAGLTDAYVGAVPAHVVLACGVFGNISDADIETTVRAFPQLCTPGASVLWTRHRREPDLTPTVRRWFTDAGFDEVAFEVLTDNDYVSVGHHRLVGHPAPLRAGRRLFTFAG
jgi:hypothetical protein